MYHPAVMTTNSTYPPLSRPLVLNVVPSNLIVRQGVPLSVPSAIPSEIINRKAKENLLETANDKPSKKVFVKIAPKPIVCNAKRIFEHTSSDSSSSNTSENLLGTAVGTLTSLGPSNLKNIHSRSDAKFADVSTSPNSRPHCPVQLSAAIALSELAAKTEEGSTVTGNDEISADSFVANEELRYGSNQPTEDEVSQASRSKR